MAGTVTGGGVGIGLRRLFDVTQSVRRDQGPEIR